MVQILIVVGAVIAVAAAALLTYAASRPGSFRIVRSATIQAPPEKLLPLINDFHRWSVWSPYEKLDPEMKRTFSGAASGPGAIYGWSSEGKAGAGRMEIIDQDPSKVVIKLDFDRPFKAHNTAEFTLTPVGGATTVAWAMHGPSPFISKVMGLVFSMDALVGKDFEVGLANLAAAVEA